MKKKSLKDSSVERGEKFPRFGKTHNVVLVYPNTYYIGMSSLGYQHIYALLNNHPEIYADRAFLTDEQVIYSYETNKPLRNFEIIFFSISYELDYMNLVKILHKSGIPIKSQDRNLDFPLIIIGGACTFFNPEPIAEIGDAFILGEGEEALLKLLDVYLNEKYDDKNVLLQSFSTVSGIYIPSIHEKYKDIQTQHIRDLSVFPAHSHIIASETEFENMLLCEISRGCAMQCKFCMVKSVYGKIRHQDPKVILDIARKYRVYTNKIGLIAPTITTYPNIAELGKELISMGYKVSFSSLRVDHLTKEIIDILVQSGQKTITIAPEAGSEKLRQSIGKNISTDTILNAVKMAVENGILNIKLYFMVGLPGETWDDVYGIVELIKDIHKIYVTISADKGKIGKLIVSVNPFIPKPCTDFEDFKMEENSILKEKCKFLQKSIRPISNMELFLENLKMANIQAVLSNGNRDLIDFLINSTDENSLNKVR